ncbi:MAG: hypothetical protein GX651_06805 [Methanomicrobiales archaeon]|nr:hypothetical protein [Methanomicrobiales archaeon]
MNSGSSPATGPQDQKCLALPTIGIIAEILANCAIIWYLLIEIPAGCARLAAETAGRQTCGLEPGAYGVAAISIILILAGIWYLAKWYLLRHT